MNAVHFEKRDTGIIFIARDAVTHGELWFPARWYSMWVDRLLGNNKAEQPEATCSMPIRPL
jgi:hypothetical protein